MELSGSKDSDLAGEEQAASPSSQPPFEEGVTAEAASENDVVGFVPRYAIPNISSMLPAYTNSEQDFIFRTFNTGNYDFLKHLPEDIKHQQVVAARTLRMEAARQFLMPKLSGPLLKSSPTNQQNLFSVFEYIPSRYSIASELEAKERVEGEAKRFAIGGKEWTPAGPISLPKNQDLTVPGVRYPYLGGPYEAGEEVLKSQWQVEQASQVEVHEAAPFVSPGTDKVTERPTKAVAWEMMNNVRKWILEDWGGADVALFENGGDCWVVRVGCGSVDSVEGLAAYMSVFVRCNPKVVSYRLQKVVEFWHTLPGDGHVYYVLRPPWVRPSVVATFYSLHPEERHWATSAGVQDVQRHKPQSVRDKDDDGDGVTPASKVPSALDYASRMDWGVNFLTGTPSARELGKLQAGGNWVMPG